MPQKHPTLARDSKTQKAYEKVLKTINYCPFCHLDKTENEIKQTYQSFLLIKNKFPYKNTRRHDLLITKDHVCSLEEFNQAQTLEFFDILKQKDFANCTILFRNAKSQDKSVTHFHAHILVFE